MMDVPTVSINKRSYKISTLHAVPRRMANGWWVGIQSMVRALFVPFAEMGRFSLREIILTRAKKRLPLRMRTWFREGFYVGAGLAMALGLYLTWLWGAEHQVRLHSTHLLAAMESKSWSKFATFVADDYQDQWGQDRAVVLQRTRALFQYLRGVRVAVGPALVQAGDGHGSWQARITIEDADQELIALLKERVNALPTPFTLEWRRLSGKPWDWRLVRVSNSGLEIPAGF